MNDNQCLAIMAAILLATRTEHAANVAVTLGAVFGVSASEKTMTELGLQPEAKDVGPEFMAYLRKVASETVGPNAPLALAMEYV